MRRKEADHIRYMRNREERKRKQREYYAANREKCIERAKMYHQRKIDEQIYKFSIMKKKVYISGPISGYHLEERKITFKTVQNDLEKQGYEVFNPMENGLPSVATTSMHMKKDIENLLTCHEIYMMDGWNHSAGCQTELLVALAIGLPVKFSNI